MKIMRNVFKTDLFLAPRTFLTDVSFLAPRTFLTDVSLLASRTFLTDVCINPFFKNVTGLCGVHKSSAAYILNIPGKGIRHGWR